MKIFSARTKLHFGLAVVISICPLLSPSYAADPMPPSRLIKPDELVKILQSSRAEKPLLIHVGFRSLYQQAHIPGSEYIGPTSRPDGLQQLRKRVESLPHTRFIVLYCGCCPWSHCPNVQPPDEVLRAMGFSKVKVLDLPNNFGADWVDKGYPVSRGQ